MILHTGVFGPNSHGWCFSVCNGQDGVSEAAGWMLRLGELQRSHLEGAGPSAGWAAAEIAAALVLGCLQAGAGPGLGCRMLHTGYRLHTGPS